MQYSDVFGQFSLPYEPLPKAAYDAASESVSNRGFSPQAILKDYSFSYKEAESVMLNALVFAHPIHRNPAEYASFTLFNAVNGQNDEELIPILAQSAAPFHLIHRKERFSFWASTIQNNQVRPIHVQSEISYEQLHNVLGDYSIDLNPQRIIGVKQGRDTFTNPIFQDLKTLQLSLWITDVTRPLLIKYFARAIGILNDYAKHSSNALPDEVITALAIQLLGITILADTGVLGDELRLESSLDILISKASESFPRYFDRDLFYRNFEAADAAYRVLRRIRYAGFIPDMLSYLYTAAYDQQKRKDLGRFDTPLYLTRRIWEMIPVEFLSPNQRVIADMTCGWGSFLIAGHERLSNLNDTKISLLRENIRGNDIDSFTAQLAGLGLLLSTSEDSWNIDHKGALEWDWLKTNQPNIIVGNPPFGSNRKIPQTNTQKRYQEADKFLEHAIDRLAPQGYLAILMPRSFLGAQASPTLRRKLLEDCKVLELWELPTEIFTEAIARTVVIFAQKAASSTPLHTFNPVRVRTLQPGTLTNFKASGKFTASGLVPNQSVWNEEARKSEFSKNAFLMDYKIILPEYTWQEIKSRSRDLDKYAQIMLGAITGKKLENKKWKDFSDSKVVPWLTGVKDIIKRPFLIDYEQAQKIRYPNDLERPRLGKETQLRGKKVLIVSDPDSTWGRRIKVAIERKNHYVSNSFWIVVPKFRNSYINHEVLAAVLSWDVSNAWIIEHLRYPWIPRRALATVPFPQSLTKEDCQVLTEAVLMLEREASISQSGPSKASQTIDTILKSAYHLDEATFQRLRRVAEWNNNSQVPLDQLPESDIADWNITGIVDSIDATKGIITLWIEGFDELQTVQIVPSMPGWMLHPNTAFCTKIPSDFIEKGQIDLHNTSWGMFYPQSYTYLTEEDLFTRLTDILHEDEKNRV